MTKQVSQPKFYLFLLLGAVLVIAMNFAFGNPGVEVLVNENKLVFGPMGLALRICAVLGIKAGLYYYARNFGMTTMLCWVDVGLTLFLCLTLMYNGRDGFVGKDVHADTVALMSLVVAAWTLVQFFVFANFMIIKLMTEKNRVLKK